MSLFNRNLALTDLLSKRKVDTWINVDGYSGPDRRRRQQRDAADRRGEWRYQLAKWPRRSGAGRRFGEHINLWYKDLCG